MVDKVKCGNKECKEFGKPVPVSLLLINKIAPLDGPWPCPVCGEEMRIAHVIPNSYKGGATKTISRRNTASKPPSKKHPVGKKRVSRGIRVSDPKLGTGRKKSTKRSPARKVMRKKI